MRYFSNIRFLLILLIDKKIPITHSLSLTSKFQQGNFPKKVQRKYIYISRERRIFLPEKLVSFVDRGDRSPTFIVSRGKRILSGEI